MKTILKGALAIASVVVAITASYGCDQPEPKCSTGRGQFIARYKPLAGASADCAAIKGEVIGVNTYSAVGDGQPDLDHASAALESTTTSTYVLNAEAAGIGDANANDKPFALGNFQESESTSNLCHVPTLAPSVQNLPEVTADDDLGTSAQPATTVTYAWANLAVYVTAQSNGTQMTADLTYNDTGAGLSCQYKVQLLYPYVDCTLVDPDLNPIMDAGGNPQIDPTACLPEENDGVGNGATKHPTGSGINPDYKVHCDPDLLACVLDDNTGLLPF